MLLEGICVDAPKLQEIRGFATAEPQHRGEEQRLNPEGTNFQGCFLCSTRLC